MIARGHSRVCKSLATLIAAVALLAGPLNSAEVQRPMGRPNVVFILVDDMGYGDLSCYGAPDVETPHIDRLAQQGVRFTNYYAAGAECTPTRVALLTGRYPQRVGGLECAIGTGNVGRYDDAIRLAGRHDLGLPASYSVIGLAMKKAGYATAVFGKWHLGYEPKFSPLNHGFDEFFGFLGGNVDYFRHRELSDLNVLYGNRKPVRRDGYMTHLITDESMRFIRANRKRPYFLYVSYSVPHFPFQGPNDDTGLLFPKNRWTKGTRAKYVEMLQDMDHNVGRLVAALNKTGVAGRTIVVFASDHGAIRPGRNAPFSGFKGGLFEGGIRTACLIRWPGHIKPRTVSDQPIITMDLTVSLLRIAGQTPSVERPLDGIDIVRRIEESRPIVPRKLFWRARRGERTWWAVREGAWKYVRKREGTKQDEWLFNLQSDPAEKDSHLTAQASTVQRLKKLLKQWERKVQPSR